LNKNVLEQIASTSEHIKDTKDLPFPESIPYFKVISKEIYETPKPSLPSQHKAKSKRLT